MTSKHNNANKKNAIYTCEQCGINFNHASSLSRHKKKCKWVLNNSNIELPVSDVAEKMDKPDIVDLLINENKEFKNVIIELFKSNSNLQQQMLDMCQKIQPGTNTINSNNNSHNKTFNLNFFLNEQCKDAMNIMEFVDTFQLQFADLERIGEVGYVEGISNIIINKLNEMDVHKRPIHCSDAKREIMYVKDNDVWDKDNETNDKIRLAIRYISKKNCELVIPWRDLHPGVRNYNHRLNDKYQEIIIQSLGGKNTTTEDGETKIIRKISKMVLIDKSMR
jgi:hypothetical protein